MTIPIARLVANRCREAEPPFRFSYVGRAYRAVSPQRGQMREFMQVGVELLGAEAPDGTAEVIEVLCAALDAAGLSRAVIGLGDADLYGQLLLELGVEGDAAERILDRLAAHDLVGLEPPRWTAPRGGQERPRDAAGADQHARRPRDPRQRPGSRGQGGREGDQPRCRRPTRRSKAASPTACRLDLGLLRDLGYYTGAILEVYDPALGHILGGGGRYDGLMASFGGDLPAAGFALYLERLHVAQAEEERVGEEGS